MTIVCLLDRAWTKYSNTDWVVEPVGNRARYCDGQDRSSDTRTEEIGSGDLDETAYEITKVKSQKPKSVERQI